MSDDPWKDPTAVAYVKHMMDDVIPQLRDSAVFLTLVPDRETTAGDIQYWTELGGAIMLDKPILAIVFGDAVVPEKLARVADEVVRLPEGAVPDASVTLTKALARLREKIE